MDTRELELILNGKSNKSTAGKIWTITKLLTAGTWCTGKFIAKNTPVVLGVAWDVKKEITSTIAEEYNNYKKEQKQLALEEKIKMLSYKGDK